MEMTTMMKVLCVLLLSVAYHTVVVDALFEEQAGLFDWYQGNIGRPQFVSEHFIRLKTTGNTKKANTPVSIVGTDENVLAALRYGEIAWRQVLPESGTMKNMLVLPGAKEIITVSGQGCEVVRAWRARDGAMVWEQVEAQMGQDNEPEHVHSTEQIFKKNVHKQGIFYSAVAPNTHSSSSSPVVCDIQYTDGGGEGAGKDAIVVSSNTHISLLSVDDGEVVWRVDTDTIENGKEIDVISTGINGLSDVRVVYALSGDQTSLYVATIDLQSGALTPSTKLEIGSDEAMVSVQGKDSRVAALTSSGLYVCDLRTKDMVTTHTSVTLSTTQGVHLSISSTSASKNTIYTITTPSAVMLYAVGSTDNALKRVMEASAGNVVSANINDEGNVLVVENRSGALEIQSCHVGTGEVARLSTSTKNKPLAASAAPVVAVWVSDVQDLEHDLALTVHLSDDTLLYISMSRGTWNTEWQREEGLASIAHSMYLAPPPRVPDSVAEVAGLGHTDEDVAVDFPGFVGRTVMLLHSIVTSTLGTVESITSHASRLLSNPQALLSSERNAWSDDELHTFGFDQRILCVGSAGKVYSLNAVNGEIMWSLYLPIHYSYDRQQEKENYSVWKLVTLSLTEVAVLTRSPSGVVISYVIDTHHATVKKVEKQSVLAMEAVSIPVSPPSDSPHSHHTADHRASSVLMLVDHRHSLHLPSFYEPSILQYLNDKVYFHSVNATSGTVTGYSVHRRLTDTSFASLEAWSFVVPQPTEKISAVAYRPDSTIKKAVKHINGGADVLFRYLNPNLLILGTVRQSPTGEYKNVPSVKRGTDPSVVIYLIDTVTGNIIDRVIQRGCTGPVHLIASENIVVYAYWNTQSQSQEVSIMELYEDRSKPKVFEKPGASPRTTFSSFDAYPLKKEQQSYTLGGSRVTSLAVTTTQHGVTSKLFLLGLGSHQLLKVPRSLLDAHRPYPQSKEVVDQARAEGIIPYHANISALPQSIVSYTHSVHNIRHIVTHEAKLESTSLSFTFGLDLFFARITPSQDFDLLSEDFNAPFLITTVTGIIVAVIITGRLQKNKQLHDQWL